MGIRSFYLVRRLLQAIGGGRCGFLDAAAQSGECCQARPGGFAATGGNLPGAPLPTTGCGAPGDQGR